MTLSEDQGARRPDQEVVVAAHWPAAVRTAYLLTGDVADAEELAARALLPGRRRPPRSDDFAVSAQTVRRRIVRLAVSPWERWTRLVHGVFTGLVVRRLVQRRPPCSPGGRPQPELFLACLRLPARERTALVLRHGAGLSESDTADALGAGLAEVHRWASRGLARLGSRLRSDASESEGVLQLDLGQREPGAEGWSGPPDSAGQAEPLVAQLRAALRDAAACVPSAATRPCLTDPATAAGTVRRSRHQQALAALVAAAAAVVALALTAAVVALVVTPPLRNGGATNADVTTWPTRGDLAGRAELVSQVRAVAGRRQPVLAVPFVGEVAGLTVAIVVTQGDEQHEVGVLYGPPAAPVASWSRREGTRLGTPELPVLSAALDDGNGLVHLVALTTTTGTVNLAWSPTAVMDADGFLRRRYIQFSLKDGVGVASTRGDVTSFAMRASTATRIVIAPFTVTAGPPAPVAFPAVHASGAPSCRFSPLAPTVDRALGLLAAERHVALAGIRRVDVVWCHSEGTQDSMLAAVTGIDGGAVQIIVDGTKSGMGAYWWSMRSYPVPSGRAATYPFTVIADDEDAFPDSRPLRVVVSAPGAVRAEIIRAGSSRVLAAARLDHEGYGVATIAAADRQLYRLRDPGLRLVLRDRTGRQIEQVAARRADDDPWGQQLDGPVTPAP